MSELLNHRVQIHANCRIRRIYFTDQLLSHKKIPAEYKAFSAVEDEGEINTNNLEMNQ
jgi:hypothetical protein